MNISALTSGIKNIAKNIRDADQEIFNKKDDPIPSTIPTLEQFIGLIKTRNLARQERFFVEFPSFENANVARDLTLLCEEAAIPGKNIQPRAFRINGINEYHAHTLDYMGDSITLQFLVDSDWVARDYMDKWMELCVNSVTQGREVGYYENYIKDITLYALIPAGLPGEELANWSPTQADTGLNEALDKFNKNTPGGVRASAALNKAMGRGKTLLDRQFSRAKQQTVGRLNLASNPIFEAFRQSEKVIYSVSLKECWPKSINVMPVSYSNPGVHRLNVTFTYKYYTTHTFNDPTLGEELSKRGTEALSSVLKKQTAKFIPAGGLPELGANARSRLSQVTRIFGR